MSQLLKITSIPINIEVNVTRAELKVDQTAPKAHVNQGPGKMQIEAEPIKVQRIFPKIFLEEQPSVQYY